MLTLYALLGASLLMLRLANPTGSFPRALKADEERRLVELSLAGDLEARNSLIEHNLRLVAHVVKKYYTVSSDTEDLISIGTIGLIKGVNTYRPDKGVRLATYAARCAENEILMYFRSIKKSSGDVSLSEALDTDSEGNSLSLMDVLAVEDDLAERVSMKESARAVRRCVESELTERESEIIRARYGLGGDTPLTQRECAARLGISRSYVSRIEKRAIEKLRAALIGEARHVKRRGSHAGSDQERCRAPVLRLRRVPARAGKADRRHTVRARLPGHHAHGRRQKHLLSGACAAAPGRDDSGLAPDIADDGPGAGPA